MNEFLRWTWRQNGFVKMLIWLSLTGMMIGMLSIVLSGFVLLIVATILSALFAAYIFPNVKKIKATEENIEKQDTKEDETGKNG